MDGTMERETKTNTGVGGSQTLMRGLDVIEAVAAGAITLQQLSDTLELTRSTTHRLAASLVERGYLGFTPRSYRLGPKLLELGHLAQEQADIVQVARPHLEELAQSTEDTVHLGILDGDLALYLDKMPGRRRITISSRVGDRQPLSSTGLGKALMLDHPPPIGTSGSRRTMPIARRMSTTPSGGSGWTATSPPDARSIWRRMRTRYAASPHRSAMRADGSSARSAYRAPPNI